MKQNTPKTILLTGCEGQVGWELQRALSTQGHVIALNHRQLDLTNLKAIRSFIEEIKPHVIVNAAAYTAVDKAESETEMAHLINGIAPGVLAEEAKKIGSLLIHYSTDYVFDGNATHPYDENHEVNPLNAYGASKLAGEQAIQAVGGHYLIFRTMWLYATRGKNFLLTMLKLGQERNQLRIVDDQVGAPTWSRLIAEATAQMLSQPFEKRDSGIYNLSCSGSVSWHGFAKAIFEQQQKEVKDNIIPELIPIRSHEYPLPAKRPAYSVLSNAKIQKDFTVHMPSWEDSLRLCLEEFKTRL